MFPTNNFRPILISSISEERHSGHNARNGPPEGIAMDFGAAREEFWKFEPALA
jgi:hypothetical protein